MTVAAFYDYDPSHLLQAFPEAILLLEDETFVIRIVNPAAEELLNLSSNALLNMPLAAIIGENSPVIKLLRQVAAEDRVISAYDIPFAHKHRTAHRIGFSAAPFAGGLILTMHEQPADARVNRVAYRGSAQSISAVAAMLGHELRNPLLSIRGAAQLLEQNLSENDRQLTMLICEEVDRIRGLIDRMEVAGEETVSNRSPVNIHDVLSQIKLGAKAGFAKDITIVEDYDPSLPPVYGNRDQLVQVFLNLVKNAAEAVQPPDGQIVLKTYYQQGMHTMTTDDRRIPLPIAVAIQDNGVGIPVELQPYIFEPFITAKTNGTGLGLPIAARIIADHEGAISCASEPGRTVFSVFLPVVPDKAQ
jgi:two-component system nitrogen regulation sensor histidine kinase GlnL